MQKMQTFTLPENQVKILAAQFLQQNIKDYISFYNLLGYFNSLVGSNKYNPFLCKIAFGLSDENSDRYFTSGLLKFLYCDTTSQAFARLYRFCFLKSVTKNFRKILSADFQCPVPYKDRTEACNRLYELLNSSYLHEKYKISVYYTADVFHVKMVSYRLNEWVDEIEYIK